MINAAEVCSRGFDAELLLAQNLSPWSQHGSLVAKPSVMPIGCLAEDVSLLAVGCQHYLYGVMIPSQHTVYASPSHCTEE